MLSAIGYGRVPAEQHRGRLETAGLGAASPAQSRYCRELLLGRRSDITPRGCYSAHPPVYVPEVFATPHGPARASTGRQAYLGQVLGLARDASARQSRKGRCSGGTGDRKRRLTALCKVDSY